MIAPWLAAVLGGLGGAVIGSFLATVAIRWPQGLSIGGRSRCDHCGVPVGAARLIPLLSYLMLGGRCRACRGPIDRTHPVVEFVCAAVGAMLAAAVALGTLPLKSAIALALLALGLILAAAMDARSLFLPRALSLAILALGLALGDVALAPLGVSVPFEQRMLGGALGGFALAGVAFAYRRARGVEGMGGGDPPFFAALGAWGGATPLPFVLLLASLAGIGVALVRRAAGRAVDDPPLPFGTLMALAFPLALSLAAVLRP